MRSARIAVAALAAACGGPTTPGDAPALLGRWAAPPETVGGGTYTRTLEFRPGGGYVGAWRTTGSYPGQRADEPSAYGRTVGRYRTDGDRLLVTVDSVVTWDRFYGAASPEVVEAPPRARVFPDGDTRFTVAGDRLVLRYPSYPADAPVPTTATYRRAR